MSPATPPGSDPVLAAVRLGWCVAELVGLSTSEGADDPGSPPRPCPRCGPCRTDTDALIGSPAVLSTIAVLLTELRGNPGTDGDEATAICAAIATSCHELRRARLAERGAEIRERCEQVSALLHRLDHHIQATVLAATPEQARGYELGRGLAELYWQLDAIAWGRSEHLAGPAAWVALEGEARRTALARLLRDLASHLGFDQRSRPAGIDDDPPGPGSFALAGDEHGLPASVAIARQGVRHLRTPGHVPTGPARCSHRRRG